jgi:hypothetical protein
LLQAKQPAVRSASSSDRELLTEVKRLKGCLQQQRDDYDETMKNQSVKHSGEIKVSQKLKARMWDSYFL